MSRSVQVDSVVSLEIIKSPQNDRAELRAAIRPYQFLPIFHTGPARKSRVAGQPQKQRRRMGRGLEGQFIFYSESAENYQSLAKVDSHQLATGQYITAYTWLRRRRRPVHLNNQAF